jgi:hypothetical protein
VGADETGFGQGNADGPNPQNKRAWLWVAVTPLVSFFQVMLSRSAAAAMALLGENFGGIGHSDRYNAYNWLDVNQRQLCWAHLIGDKLRLCAICQEHDDKMLLCRLYFAN